jgi:hypothetical protein
MWALWRVGAPGPAVALDPRAMTGASVAAPAFGSSAGATPVARELRRCTPPASGAPGPAGSVEPRAMTGAKIGAPALGSSAGAADDHAGGAGCGGARTGGSRGE